jgi:hypothetical protein
MNYITCPALAAADLYANRYLFEARGYDLPDAARRAFAEASESIDRAEATRLFNKAVRLAHKAADWMENNGWPYNAKRLRADLPF